MQQVDKAAQTHPRFILNLQPSATSQDHDSAAVMYVKTLFREMIQLEKAPKKEDDEAQKLDKEKKEEEKEACEEDDDAGEDKEESSSSSTPDHSLFTSPSAYSSDPVPTSIIPQKQLTSLKRGGNLDLIVKEHKRNYIILRFKKSNTTLAFAASFSFNYRKSPESIFPVDSHVTAKIAELPCDENGMRVEFITSSVRFKLISYAPFSSHLYLLPLLAIR